MALAEGSFLTWKSIWHELPVCSDVLCPMGINDRAITSLVAGFSSNAASTLQLNSFIRSRYFLSCYTNDCFSENVLWSFHILLQIICIIKAFFSDWLLGKLRKNRYNRYLGQPKRQSYLQQNCSETMWYFRDRLERFFYIGLRILSGDCPNFVFFY